MKKGERRQQRGGDIFELLNSINPFKTNEAKKNEQNSSSIIQAKPELEMPEPMPEGNQEPVPEPMPEGNQEPVPEPMPEANQEQTNAETPQIAGGRRKRKH